MPEYQFSNRNGEIVVEEYQRYTHLSIDQIKQCILTAFDLFCFPVTVEQVENMEDVFRVSYTVETDIGDIYICAKGTTPGGRSGLMDEQRIQPKAKFLNYVYGCGLEGKKAVFLGIYIYDGQTIFCTWKVTSSAAASEETPISKQIKITSIAKAMQEGFVQQDKGGGEYACAFRPEFLYFYLRNSDWLHTGHVHELADHTQPEFTGYETTYERNRIIFGAPGTGKSNTVKNDCRRLLAGTSGNFERVTFHPEYSYSQFVGTYKPVTDGGDIAYRFVPGPFMRIYAQALKSARTGNVQPFVLIIEEINRAKVASVFGDVFQLLDRDEHGVSEYEIQASEDIKKYLAAELDGVEGNPNNYSRIKIPDNMFIWATMNSADQGVFPMDTAFKRRWFFEYLGIDDNDATVGGSLPLGNGTHEAIINWNQLRKAINERLAVDYRINEDKLIGPFFINKDIFAFDENGRIVNPDRFKQVFKSKVIMYLYEDAAKQYKSRLFSGCDNSKYSSVCRDFDEIGIDIFGDGFRDLYNRMGE